MPLTRAEIDRRADEAKRKRDEKAATSKSDTLWSRFKTNAGKAAKAVKAARGTGKGRSMMASLNRMSNYDPFGPRKRSTHSKKRSRKSSGKRPYKTVTYYR
jgi:hypothetical protein